MLQMPWTAGPHRSWKSMTNVITSRAFVNLGFQEYVGFLASRARVSLHALFARCFLHNRLFLLHTCRPLSPPCIFVTNPPIMISCTWKFDVTSIAGPLQHPTCPLGEVRLWSYFPPHIFSSPCTCARIVIVSLQLGWISSWQCKKWNQPGHCENWEVWGRPPSPAVPASVTIKSLLRLPALHFVHLILPAFLTH